MRAPARTHGLHPMIPTSQGATARHLVTSRTRCGGLYAVWSGH